MVASRNVGCFLKLKFLSLFQFPAFQYKHADSLFIGLDHGFPAGLCRLLARIVMRSVKRDLPFKISSS